MKEYNLEECPMCRGPADNGFSRSVPPVPYFCTKCMESIECFREDEYKPLDRKWVGLTEQDVHDAFQFTELIKQLDFYRDRQEWCENFAAYIEVKLKEKNHGRGEQ